MKTEYNLSEVQVLDSFSFTGISHPFPYGVDMGAIYHCGDSYYTKRDRFSHSILLYTLSGCGSYEYRGMQGMLPQGTLLLLDSRFPHWYGTAEGMCWDFIWMHYYDDGNYSISDYFFEMGIEVLQIPQEVMQKFFYEIKKLSNKAMPLTELQAAQKIIHFFEKWGVYNFQNVYPVTKEYGEIITAAQIYIQENYSKKILLKELAESCSVDPYHMIRLFKKYLGLTPHQYLLHVRISRARLLLVSTDKTVTQIGDEVGFGDGSTFIATFRKITGCTPLQYRKNIK